MSFNNPYLISPNQPVRIGILAKKGIKEDFSDIFIFKIGRSQDSTSTDLEFLKELIGEEVFSQYFGPNGEFNGFSLIGIQLNGDDVGIQDLEGIITKIKEGNADVKEVSVE